MRVFPIVVILFVLIAGVLFFFQDKENSQIGFVIPDGLNLEERRKFFAARAVSENLQKVCSVTATEYVKVL